jgi:hypothetical protein
MPWWQVSGFLIVLALPEGHWRAASRILARRAAKHISRLTRGPASTRTGAALLRLLRQLARLRPSRFAVQIVTLELDSLFAIEHEPMYVTGTTYITRTLFIPLDFG